VGDDSSFDLFQTANKSNPEGPAILRDFSLVKRGLKKEVWQESYHVWILGMLPYMSWHVGDSNARSCLSCQIVLTETNRRQFMTTYMCFFIVCACYVFPKQ
jgi:hypothetical protein